MCVGAFEGMFLPEFLYLTPLIFIPSRQLVLTVGQRSTKPHRLRFLPDTGGEGLVGGGSEARSDKDPQPQTLRREKVQVVRRNSTTPEEFFLEGGLHAILLCAQNDDLVCQRLNESK